MTRARNLSDLLDSNGDVKSGALDNVPASDVVNDTTPQLGGDLDTNGNDVNFGDNDKATFGASDDLQIYHSGTHSFIDDAGIGNLYIRSSDMRLQKYTGENMIVATADAAVTLYYDNSAKLATTSTGVDISGDLTLYAEGSNNLRVNVRQGSAKAWHSYVGTGTVSTSDSFNVSGLSDLGTGSYRTSFINSTNNSNYSVPTSANFNNTQCDIAGVVSRLTASCVTDCMHDDGGARDMAGVYLTLHGDLA